MKTNVARLSACAVLLAAPAAGPARADAIDIYLRTAIDKAHIPAVAVAIVRYGRVTKLAAYGTANLEDGVKATPDSAFALASGTKFFTGVLVMRMVEQGKLELSERLGAILPGAPEAWRDVTVAQLAAHTSGIPDALALTAPVKDASSLVEVLKDRPLVYKPGARSIYNQTEFAVVRLILEKVSGRPFERLLNDEIVRPLGLTSTRFSNLREEPDIAGSSTRSADIVPRRAPLYNWDGSKQQISEFIYPSWSYAAGGLYSSAADLAKLLQAIETGRLLSKASLQALQTPYRLNDGKDGTFGVAWVVRHRRGRLTVGHSGGPADSDIWMWPERGLSVAVLTDQQNFAPVLADGVAQIVDPAPAPSHAAVADDDPATSARLLAWAEGVAKGVADQDMLAKGAVRGMAQQLRMLQPVLAIAPGIQDWTLTATNSGPGGSRTRTYAARQGAAHMLWTFYLDREGKILGLAPQPE